MKSTAAVSLNRIMNGRTEDTFRLTVTDESSGIQFCEISFTGLQLANMITGLHQSHVPVEFNGLELVGMRAEHRTVNVCTDVKDVRGSIERRDEIDAEFASQYPQLFDDGWRISYYGWVGNPHYRVNGSGDSRPCYSATIVRYVSRDGEDA